MYYCFQILFFGTKQIIFIINKPSLTVKLFICWLAIKKLPLDMPNLQTVNNKKAFEMSMEWKSDAVDGEENESIGFRKINLIVVSLLFEKY